MLDFVQAPASGADVLMKVALGGRGRGGGDLIFFKTFLSRQNKGLGVSEDGGLFSLEFYFKMSSY